MINLEGIPNKDWLNHDIAVEIIGRMIGDKVQEIRELGNISDFSKKTIIENQIMKYHADLQQLYKCKDDENILLKVRHEYAPYILEKYGKESLHKYQLA